MPSEHGGWGLTLEPVLLGLLVAPSLAGALLAIAAFLAFLVRTPLKLALVDRRRGRHLARTTLAARIAAGEAAAVALLAAFATLLGDPRWWLVVLAALPLIGVELWFDVRSRSRRLAPELAGAAGIAGSAAAVVLAAGEGAGLAVALWLVLAARSTTSIPFVRDQVARLHGRSPGRTPLLAGDAGAVVLAGAAVVVAAEAAVGGVAVLVVVAFQRLAVHRPAPTAVALGVQQTVVGLLVVLATAVGVWLD